MGGDPAECRFFHAEPVRQRRLPGKHTGAGLFCEVRRRNDDPGRHRSRHRQYPGRICALETGGIRGHSNRANHGSGASLTGDRLTIHITRSGTMAEFTVNAQRFDPYKNFKFRLKWDGRYVAGISKVSALKRTTEVVKHREGGDPSTSRKSPGRTEFDAITLERGVTHDVEFENWAGKVWQLNAGLGAEVSLKDFRKDLLIEVYNEAGQVALTYKLYRCWVSEYQALP